MSDSFDISGEILEIFPEKQINENFKKREFVLEHAPDPQYPDYLKFEVVQNKTILLDKYKVGDKVSYSEFAPSIVKEEVDPTLDELYQHILDEEPDLYVEPLTAREEYEKEIRECVEWRAERPTCVSYLFFEYKTRVGPFTQCKLASMKNFEK